MEMYRPPFMARPPMPPPPPAGHPHYSSEPMARESSPSRQSKVYIPSSKAQLILNRLSMDQPRGGYSPAPRLPPRMPPPPYYDYDYGYGGYGGYGGGYGYGGYPSYAPPPPMPRYSGRRYDLDDDYDLSYMPRYRPLRYSDTLAEIEKDKLRSPSPSVPTSYTSSSYMPGLEGEEEAPPFQTRTKIREPGPPTEEQRYSSLSEPQMLQDQVDKMRMRLKNLAYSLDPTGPVPEIIVPERSRRCDSTDIGRKYSSGMELAELPRTIRRQHYYPEDDHMKDNLRIKCLSHYKTTRTAAGYCKPKLYQPSEALSNTYSSKYPLKTTSTTSKWEEPDTVYGSSSDRKPYSKPEEEEDDTKKERRKKKKSKERDEVPTPAASIESSYAATPAAEVPSEGVGLTSEVSDAISAPSETPAEGGEELDEKEKKRLEKKKRKAEREAAAKAAMEAELEALAAAEAELARLEEDALKADIAAAQTAEPTKEAQGSETAAEKCESPTTIPSEDLPECSPTELEPEPSSPQPALDSTASEPVPESVASEVEEEKAVPGSVVEPVSVEQEPATPEPPLQDTPEPAPAEEVASAPPQAEEAYEEPPIKPKPQGEDAFDWNTYEAEGSGGDVDDQQIGTQESVPEDKDLHEGGEEVTTQEPVDTQPEEHPSEEPEHKGQEPEHKEQEPEAELKPELSPTTEEQHIVELHTESGPLPEEKETAEETVPEKCEEPVGTAAVEQIVEETPAVSEQKVEETPVTEQPLEEPRAEQTVEEIIQEQQNVEEIPQEQTGTEQQSEESPKADFKPLDESDSFWGTED